MEYVGPDPFVPWPFRVSSEASRLPEASAEEDGSKEQTDPEVGGPGGETAGYFETDKYHWQIVVASEEGRWDDDGGNNQLGFAS